MHRSLWLLWGIGLAVAVGLTGWRWQIERRDRTVALVVDGMEVRLLQALTGDLEKVLESLRTAGATAVAVSPETLHDWAQIGRVTIVSHRPPLLAASSRQPLDRLRESFQRQWQQVLPPPHREGGQWLLPLPSEAVLQSPLPIGLDQELAEAVRRAGLGVVARLPNPMGLTEKGVRFWMDEVRQSGAFAVLFEGEEVFGYRTMLPQVAQALKELGVLVGLLELTAQKGDRTLGRLIAERVVRVHSVSLRELPNFTLPELTDRFSRAVRERNIRLCYIRLPAHWKGEPLQTAADYLSALRAELERNGFLVGQPKPLPSVTAPFPLWALVWLGAVAVGVAFLTLFVPLTIQQQWTLLMLVGAFGFALRFLVPLWAAKLGAFGIAVMAPVLALWLGYRQTLDSKSRWQRMAKGLATCLAFLLACGVMEAALLFDHRFWLKVDEFAGVKLSQLLPLLLVLMLSFAQWWETEALPPKERWAIAGENFRSLSNAPVRWGQVALLVMAGILVAYWLMRTGNEPSVGVASWELKLRAFFEDWLIARPRFKEFVLGHPALVLAFFFLTGTHLEAKIGQWLFLPAVIGLASVMNTFSHAHTPIALSLLRTVHGIWLGIGIGLMLLWGMKWVSASRDRRVLMRQREPLRTQTP